MLRLATFRSSRSVAFRAMSSGPTTATPPPDASRGATADLCDVFLPEPVDKVTQSKVQIVEPIFRYSRALAAVSRSGTLSPLTACGRATSWRRAS